MSSRNCIDKEGPCIVFLTVVSVFAVGLISMLVCGILGKLGKLPMAPIGARIMIGFPMGFIFAMVVLACHVCSSSRQSTSTYAPY